MMPHVRNADYGVWRVGAFSDHAVSKASRRHCVTIYELQQGRGQKTIAASVEATRRKHLTSGRTGHRDAAMGRPSRGIHVLQGRPAIGDRRIPAFLVPVGTRPSPLFCLTRRLTPTTLRACAPAASCLAHALLSFPLAVTKPALPAEPTTLPAVGPVFGPSNPAPAEAARAPVKFYASMVGLDPSKEKTYRELHAQVWPEVVAAIHRANIRNFNIFVTEIAGRRYLFSHFEYIGTDPESDFASIGGDPTTRDRWWPLTDACQIRLPGTPAGEQWRSMEQVMRLP